MREESAKPRIIFLVDRPDWVFDFVAHAIAEELKEFFDFRIEYVVKNPVLSDSSFEILYVFFWGETYHHKFNIDSKKIIKEISSHRWENEEKYGLLKPGEMAERFLLDAGHITTTSLRILNLFLPYRDITYVPNGFDEKFFYNKNKRAGKLVVGWVGNKNDSCKGISDIIQPACEGRYELKIAGGNITSREDMADFYNSIDIIAVASTAEGQPITLIEGMACGCFPVTVDVGIVPELIENKKNGLVVERSVQAFTDAFQWCENNLEIIRKIGDESAEKIKKERTWLIVAKNFKQLFQKIIDNNMNQKLDYINHLERVNCGGWSADGYASSKSYYDVEISPCLPVNPEASIVDIGSGFGYLAEYLLECGYKNIGCVDTSEGLLNIIKKRIGKKLSFIQKSDATCFLKETKKKFDVISMIDVIEHFTLEQAKEVVASAFEALNPGGVFILRTPNMANLLGVYSRYIDLTHCSGYTEFSLRQLLLDGKFESVDVVDIKWQNNKKAKRRQQLNTLIHRFLFKMQDRSMPQCFDKNITLYATKK